MPTDSGADPVALLQRWQDCGAVWRVLRRDAARGTESVTIGLYDCTDSEEVDRFTSSDPRLLSFLDQQP